MANERSREVVPPEVDEADWLDGHQGTDDVLGDGIPPGSLGERLAAAGEGDLLESTNGEPTAELPRGLPFDAAEADVLEQRQLPTGAGDVGELDEQAPVEEEGWEER